MAATIQTIEKPTKARALDTSGNNNHGQIYSGRALEFDGSTDYLTYTSTGNLEEFTAVGWMNCYGDTGNIQNIWDGNAAATYPCIYNGTPKISWYAPVVNWLQTGKVIEYNTWYRVVFVFKRNGSGGDYRVYINGLEDTGGDFPAIGVGTHTEGYFDGIGSVSQGTNRFFNGMMSDMQVWNTSWTAADVAFDYANPEQLALNRGGTSLTNFNLKLWYPMNDGHRGKQSYILDASNTGLGDELLTTTDLTTIGNQAITAGTTLNGWTHHATYQYDSVTASSDGIRIVSNGSNDLGSAYQSFHTNPFVLTAGKTYRLEYSFTVHSGAFALNVMNNPVGSSAGITRNGITGTENNTVKYFTASSNADASNYIEIYSTATNAFDATISYVSLKPVNNKNHATTVFYGDEQITDSKNRDFSATSDWTSYGSPTTFTDDGSGKLTVVTAGDGGNEGCQLALNLIDGAGGAHPIVVGRKYRISVKLDNTAGKTTPDINISIGGYAANIVRASDGSTGGTIDTTEQEYYADIVAINSSALLIYQSTGDNNATTTFTIDDVSVKEVGVASGWTDADQQLDIPQTALQSYNQLAWWNGESDYVQLSDPYNHNLITVSAWIYLSEDNASHKCWFANRDSGNDGILATISGSEKIFVKFNGATCTSSAAVSIGEWNHIVYTYDDATMKLYINGEQDSTTTSFTSSDISVTTNAKIGQDSMATTYEFPGSITEVSIWGVALTQAEINELYNDGKALDATIHSKAISASTNLKGYFRNNGLATWTDLSDDYSNNGTVTASETMLITAGADATRDSQGFLMNRQRVINSLNLDYNQSYNLIRKGLDTDNITADGGSFSAWIYPTDMGGGDYGRIFEKGGIHYCYIQAFSSDTCKLVYATKFSSSGICNFTTDNRDITLNEWNYISVTYDGSATGNAALIYVNGVLVDSSEDETRSGTIVDDSGHDMYVGNRADFIRHFDGQIDDLNFYSDILTAAEVKRNYNAGKRSHR